MEAAAAQILAQIHGVKRAFLFFYDGGPLLRMFQIFEANGPKNFDVKSTSTDQNDGK